MSYLLWRILYVAIKPLCLLLAGRLVSVEIANLLAIIVTISAVLMAALSFGSYKEYLNTSGGDRVKHGRHRVNVYLLNALILLVLSTLMSVLYSDWDYFLLIAVVVLAEHLIHDEARVLLYQGHKRVWAKQNTIRTFVLYGALLVASLESKGTMLIISCLVFAALAIRSYYSNGVFSYLKAGVRFEPGFLKKYLSGFEYFKSSLVNKFGQQSDRVYYYFIAPDTLWVYTLLAQSASVMLTYFDVMHIAKFKSKLLTKKLFQFSLLTLPQAIELAIIGSSIVFGVAVLEYVGVFPDLLHENFFMLAILVIGNYIVVTNTLNSERMFWSIRHPKTFSLIEIKSFLVGLLIVVPVLVHSSLVFVRVPFLLGCTYKLYRAKQCLK